MSLLGLAIVCLFMAFQFTVVAGSKLDQLTSYDDAYQLGMDAYKKEKWSQCASFFQSAIKDYHFYQNSVIDCRLKCKDKNGGTSFASLSDMFHDLLLQSNCLRRCNKKKLGSRAEVEISSSVNKKFEDRTPYNYMQFCYYKDGQYKEAAAAAYTYFTTHQDEERIVENLQYYRTLDGISEKDFRDLERRPYQIYYIHGMTAYNDGNWEKASSKFEKSLSHYYKEEERCRAGCENGFTHSGFPDFISAVADHYVTVVACQQKCLKKLSTFGMENLDDFLSEHYNYLQYSYYQANNLKKAFESIANFLLFKPHDRAMLKNKDYYMETLTKTDEDFVPSKMVVEYIEMWQGIEKSLDFVRIKYILPKDEITDEDEDIPDQQKYIDSGAPSVNRSANVVRFERLGLKLVAESKQLKGMDRFMVDNLIREDQCASLADLARSQEPDDDGVKQISVIDSIDLVEEDEGYEISLRLLIRGSDIIKAYTSAYFNQSELQVEDVKVICRSAGVKSGKSMTDDCILQENGKCYDSRLPTEEYMLVAYLTDMLDGTGQFYFLDDDDNVQWKIVPECGRLVGFSGKNHHGTNLPWNMERCALVMTLNTLGQPNADLQEARDFLSQVQEDRLTDYSSVDNTNILQQFYSQGVKITQQGAELLGPERFVADRLATQTECDKLIHLARKQAIAGDGYRGRKSPHSEREIFFGLTVKHADKLGKLEGDGYQDNQRDSLTASKFASPYSQYENFEGLNVTRSIKLVESEEISANILHLFLDVSEHARLLVEKYFNLTQPLYFDYTHLVCRTAIEGDMDEDEDEVELSHPVHADNCMIQPDGSCIPDPLAYIQRHYSAVLYLNEEFEGGQFFFAHKNKSEQISVQPTCGRLVAFNAGDFHGVKAVTRGQRCAIAMWYTHNPDFTEVSRLHAYRRIVALEKEAADDKNTDDKSSKSTKTLETTDSINFDSDSKTTTDTKESKIITTDTGDAVEIESDLGAIKTISDKQTDTESISDDIGGDESSMEHTETGDYKDIDSELDLEDVSTDLPPETESHDEL